MNQINLKQFGFDEKIAAQALQYPGLHAGRVISQFKGLYRAVTENGELMSEVSGKLLFK